MAGPVELQPQRGAPASATAGPCARMHLRRGAADRLRPEVVQLAQRRGVEGAGLHPADAEVAQPGAHLARRPGGEGDGEHPLRLVGARVHAVGDAVGDRPGLAGAGAGEHAHGPARAGRDLALLGVERGEDVVGGRGLEGQAGLCVDIAPIFSDGPAGVDRPAHV